MYSEKTLLKFNKDKTLKFFPGNAIINVVKDGEIIKLLIEIKRKMEQSKLFDKFVFLPENSYHMTVCDLVTYTTLTTSEMFKNFLFVKEKNIDLIDKKIMEILEKEYFDLNVTMKAKKITSKQVRLEPKTEEDKEKLDRFRKIVYHKLNINMNESYKFHISLTYQLQELSTEEQKAIDEFLENLNSEYLEKFGDIHVNCAKLMAFNDMSEFRVLSSGREKLGAFEKIDYEIR